MLPSLARLKKSYLSLTRKQEATSVLPEKRLSRSKGENSIFYPETRFVAAFYANPVFPKQLIANGAFLPLTALTRDMRYVVSTTNPYDFSILPATTWKNMQDAIQKFKPIVVIWSGHTTFDGSKRALVFETEQGFVDPFFVTAQTLSSALEKMDSVKLVCLMGCETTSIVNQMPPEIRTRCKFISWKTIVEDNAAVAFVSGLVDGLREYAVESLDFAVVDAQSLFDRACSKFIDAGFKFGDPILSNHTTQGQPHLSV